MRRFNTNIIKGFVFKLSAELYAWRARRAGYDTRISFGKQLRFTSGRWWVAVYKAIEEGE